MIDSLLRKNITWNGSQWLCDDLTVCVKMETEKGYIPIDIDGKGIKISSQPDCLEMGNPQMGVDKRWFVPLRLKDGFTIVPGGVAHLNEEDRTVPPCSVGKPLQREVARKKDEIQVELAVSFVPPGLGAAMGAAGMIPGGAAIMNQVIPPLTLKSKITYEVQTPQADWSVLNDYTPLLLCENAEQEVFVGASFLPPGWGNTAQVIFALSERSEQLKLRLRAAPEENASGMNYRLRFLSTQICMKLVQELQENSTDNTDVEFLAMIKSEHLGTQVTTLMLDAEALELCLYFAGKPAALYTWNEQNKIIVIPYGKENVAAPKSCRLLVSLRCRRDWALPPMKWEFDESLAMNDRIEAKDAASVEYIAPGMETWKGAGSPEKRVLWCKAGTGTELQSTPVADYPDLYTFMAIAADIYLTDKLRKAYLKVRIGPADLLINNTPLELSNQEIMKSLLRETTVEVEYF